MIWRMLGMESLDVTDIDDYFGRTEGKDVNFLGVIQGHAHASTGLIAWHTKEDGDYLQDLGEVSGYILYSIWA